ncbi:MAG: DEAD/DEAH box helicase [Alphaproteobacteria bacterium]
MQHVANCCRSTFRAEDLISALSDRALGLLLFDISRESARMVLNRLRWNVRNHVLSFGGKSDFSVTISIAFGMLGEKDRAAVIEAGRTGDRRRRAGSAQRARRIRPVTWRRRSVSPALFPWFAPVTSLKYVGPAIAAALTRLLPPRGSETQPEPPILRDLLFHLPVGVIDRRAVTPVALLKKGDYATVEVEIAEHVAPPRIKHRLPYKVATRDATGLLILNFFHVKGDYLARQLPVGSKRLISGTVDFYDGNATIAHPDVMAPAERAADVLKLAPSYALTAGLSQKVLGKAIAQGFEKVAALPEWHDATLLTSRHWPGFFESLRALHFPGPTKRSSPRHPSRARGSRMTSCSPTSWRWRCRAASSSASPSFPIPYHKDTAETLAAALPFALTQGQLVVLKEMLGDIASGNRMVRLLQGRCRQRQDRPRLRAHGAGGRRRPSRAALMAPTDLLARQHLQTLQPLADALHIPIALISGKMRKRERDDVQAALAAGKIPLVIGTHALFQEDVAFANLALIVVDEQHRFGVAQRMRLTGKGRAPHLLQMTATPIPRSLTMALYGDMDVCALTERPPGRKEIDTPRDPGGAPARGGRGLKPRHRLGRESLLGVPADRIGGGRGGGPRGGGRALRGAGEDIPRQGGAGARPHESRAAREGDAGFRLRGIAIAGWRPPSSRSASTCRRRR